LHVLQGFSQEASAGQYEFAASQDTGAYAGSFFSGQQQYQVCKEVSDVLLLLYFCF
jgi:hypothetical protein